ncbi:MAG: hypothetical protein KTR28_03480 [Micavibrio sp.]|nr:hypothetical protein [Micavibrio sp.]
MKIIFYNKTLSIFALGLLVTVGLSACGTSRDNLKEAQFWQRTASSDALYMQGPKAQQILHRDIARCVTELRELERMGAVKNAIPAGVDGHVLTEEEQYLAEWDSPERNKDLFAEHTNYSDFEGCMDDKGWQRVEHVPYKTGIKGRNNYLRANVYYEDEPDPAPLP